MGRGGRRWRSRLLLVLVAVGILWGWWKWSEAPAYWKTLAQIEEQIEKGLISRAAKELVELSASYPDSDQAAFLLGICEKARGRNQEATAAWSRVPPSSRFAFRAIESRVEMELEDGRLSEAEQLVLQTCADRQFIGPDSRILLGAIYSEEGRHEEALKLIETLWQRHHQAGEAASETAINQLWLFIQLRSNPVPVERVRDVLDRAGRIAPDDDRIWLWKANLAVRTGSYQEAARWLERCLARRPTDPAVWRVRLNWAVATNRAAAAREALKHLPAAGWNASAIERLTAWFAAHRGDDEAERASLARLIAADPCDFAALDRLIALRVKSGQADAAAALRHQRDEVARLQARYDKLFKRHQPRRDAAEMGRLAGQLGRRFEASAFLTIALASNRNTPAIRNDLARLEQSSEKSASSARTLEEQLWPQLNDHTEKPASAPRPQSQLDGASPGG
jgi:enediyne biosynthesis protein E4